MFFTGILTFWPSPLFKKLTCVGLGISRFAEAFRIGLIGLSKI